jgi:3D (Asp-Asp-Asp) domain-containing protein
MSTLVALSSNDQLLTFDSANPQRILDSVTVRGLRRGEDLVGIDFRPADGRLYGVSDRDRVYVIDIDTGAAAAVGTGLAVGLRGQGFGVDFNPVVDRLRLVSDSNQNLRINPNDGASVDGDPALAGIQGDTDLAYAPGDAMEGRAPDVVAAAYTNNFLGTTTTTLYGLDARGNTLVRQGGLNVPPGTPSPNGGQLFTVGALGINIDRSVGFDIAADGTAFASVRGRDGRSRGQLVSINLDTGAATVVGRIGNGQTIEGLAVVLREEVVYAVTASNRLVQFRANDPSQFLSSVPISGLLPGEDVSGIDFRPATGELFSLTSTNRVLRIDAQTGQGIVVGNAIDPGLFASGQAVGFDFNPTVDRLRLVNEGNDNLRYNPVTFAPVDGDAATAGIQADTDLAYDASDPNAGVDPVVVASAYDRNDNNPATPTTLYGIDSDRNTLVRQGAVDGNAGGVGGSPNGGLLFTQGALGVNVTGVASLDIAGDGFGGNGLALAALQVEGEAFSRLYTINLATGGATQVGMIGGELIRAMAIAPPRFQFSAPSFSVKENDRVAFITVNRVGGSRGAASVSFTTSDGSAQAGSDYEAVSQVLTFADGETSKVVPIRILNDRAGEGPETVNLSLFGPTGGAIGLGDDSTAFLIIRDND